ncbi:ornithine cyclodeaminase family protein [Bacillaceae bacterium Marseille-Q3522]|nr:ornithine cyclodeaminase family protein [Bacillaceae bacterium Marseille-Q3522]
MLVINKAEVIKFLSVKKCIEIMKSALADLARGEAIQNLRSVIQIENGGILGQMPGYLQNKKILGTKVISVFADNHQYKLPSHQGVVLLFDSVNGELKAVVDGTAITAIRTAAVSAVATDLLAKKEAATLCLLGAGEQARSHLEAILAIRPIKRVNVWSRHKETAMLFKREMEEKFSADIQVCSSAERAANGAAIICTVTASEEPVLKNNWVMDGAHINAVGACRPNSRELDSELVARSEFYVDRSESAQKESGDYLIPLQEGKIKKTHIIGEIGEILIGKIKGRESNKSITVFDSLGLAIEDLAAAYYIYQQAENRAVEQKK